MIGCPGLWIRSIGHRGLTKCENQSRGCVVVGRFPREDFQEKESEGLLPVLHLSSDWSGSPEIAP